MESSNGHSDRVFQEGMRELAREVRARQEQHLKVASEASWTASMCSVAIAAATFSAAVASGVSDHHPQPSLTGLTAVLTGVSAFLILVGQTIQPAYHAAKHQALVDFYVGFMHRLERSAMTSFANHLTSYSTRLTEKVDELASMFPLAMPFLLSKSLDTWRWQNIPERPTVLDRCIFLRKSHMEVATWLTDCHAGISIILIGMTLASTIFGALNSNRADGKPVQAINHTIVVLNVIVAILTMIAPALASVFCPLQRTRCAGMSYVACNAVMEDLERSVGANLSLLLDPPVITVPSVPTNSILVVTTPRGTFGEMNVTTKPFDPTETREGGDNLRPSLAEAIEYLWKLHSRVDKLHSQFPPIFSMPPFAWWKEAKNILPSQLRVLQDKLVTQQAAHADHMKLHQQAKGALTNGKVVLSIEKA